MSNPVTLAELKRHVNISHLNLDHDTYLTSCLATALAEAETFTNRKFITETVTRYFHGWPASNEIVLPYGELQSVTSVHYKDLDGDWTEFTSGYFTVQTEDEPGRIVLEDGESWPTTTLHPSLPVRVIYVCGYGDAADVPAPIKAAIQLSAADLFEQRETIVVGVTFHRLKTFESLLWPYMLKGSFV